MAIGHTRGDINVTAPACWMPLHLLPNIGAAPTVDWFDLGSLRFDAPFFVETVYRAQCRYEDDPLSGPFRRQTPMSDLINQAATELAIDPTGFIFHLARCGSTLVSQMLAALPDHIVLAEAVPIDGVLRTRFWGSSEEERVGWLRAVVGALGRRRSDNERRLFIKFDAWHVTELPLIRRAFPDVPWIFLYRDPVEVLVSHDRSTAALTIPGAIPSVAFGLDPASAAMLSPIAYAAQVTSTIAEAALAQLGSCGRLVRYDELPSALPAILTHFGVQASDAELGRMMEVAGENAKARGMAFVPDSQTKRAEATDEIWAAAALLQPVMDRLDGVRRREPAVVV